MDPSQVLRPILDIRSVEGVAFINKSGAVANRAGAEYLPDQALAGLAQRAETIITSVGDSVDNPDELLVRFSLKSLYCKKFEAGLLVVVFDHDIKLSNLRIAVTLVTKSLASAVGAPVAGGMMAGSAPLGQTGMIPQTGTQPAPGHVPTGTHGVPGQAPTGTQGVPAKKTKRGIWD